jgi:hypothetical protein
MRQQTYCQTYCIFTAKLQRQLRTRSKPQVQNLAVLTMGVTLHVNHQAWL